MLLLLLLLEAQVLLLWLILLGPRRTESAPHEGGVGGLRKEGDKGALEESPTQQGEKVSNFMTSRSKTT